MKRISAFGLRAAMLGATSIIASTAIAEPVLAQEPAEPYPAAAKAAREKAEADYRALSGQIGQRAGDPAFDYALGIATIDSGRFGEVIIAFQRVLAGLADIYATGGKTELVARIADRIALTPIEGRASHYLLADDRGRRIAGDLAEWPPLDPAVSESGIISIGANSRGFARTVQLGPDLRLVVARGIDIEAPVLSSIAVAFAAGRPVFVALVAMLGRFAALGLQRRIGRINLAFREPQDGAGLAAAGRLDGDEIDKLPPTAPPRWRGSIICWRPTRTPPNNSPTRSAPRSRTSTTGW